MSWAMISHHWSKSREGASEDRRGAYAVLTAAGLQRLQTALQYSGGGWRSIK
jgi:hypothetical protein